MIEFNYPNEQNTVASSMKLISRLLENYCLLIHLLEVQPMGNTVFSIK